MKMHGVFIIGALGEVATTMVVGAEAMKQGLVDATGLVTGHGVLSQLDLPAVDHLVFGGVDIREGSWDLEAELMVKRGGAIPWQVFEKIQPELKKLNAPYLLSPPLNEGGMATDRLEIFKNRLRSFKTANNVDDLIILNLASTEVPTEQDLPWTKNQNALEQALKDPSSDIPDSVLWALVAIQEQVPHINFTPSTSLQVPSLQEMAKDVIPYAGNDGKTGETLVKTVFAPMFSDRNFKVLSWEGLNLLGNRDGEVLKDPHKARGKISNKDKVLHDILGKEVHSKVRIDYTPSLGDFKTAWNLIHFEGFMGAKMSFQFTWQGCDSALAAPLCLDLVRLTHLARERGETGPMSHLACFFKKPLDCDDARFFQQMEELNGYAAKVYYS